MDTNELKRGDRVRVVIEVEGVYRQHFDRGYGRPEIMLEKVNQNPDEPSWSRDYAIEIQTIRELEILE